MVKIIFRNVRKSSLWNTFVLLKTNFSGSKTEGHRKNALALKSVRSPKRSYVVASLRNRKKKREKKNATNKWMQLSIGKSGKILGISSDRTNVDWENTISGTTISSQSTAPPPSWSLPRFKTSRHRTERQSEREREKESRNSGLESNHINFPPIIQYVRSNRIELLSPSAPNHSVPLRFNQRTR